VVFPSSPFESLLSFERMCVASNPSARFFKDWIIPVIYCECKFCFELRVKSSCIKLSFFSPEVVPALDLKKAIKPLWTAYMTTTIHFTVWCVKFFIIWEWRWFRVCWVPICFCIGIFSLMPMLMHQVQLQCPLNLKSMFVGFVLGKAEIWVLHSMCHTSIWDFVCYHYAVSIIDYCVKLLTQSHWINWVCWIRCRCIGF